ncbi:hypothetical protein [Embleya sp. NPDC050493]|uniref:hypothetical protein n=1 Tax=Embleya sp. NPDC050493 TaxID=3363989 RepID=UPI0037BBCCD7
MTTSEIRTLRPEPATPARGRVLRTLRVTVLSAQLASLACLLGAVPVPGAALLGGGLLLPVLLGSEALVWRRLRRRGLSRREAFARLVPERARRCVVHEARIMASLARWAVRRPYGVDRADAVFPHARDQAALIFGLAFACVIETLAMSYLLADRPVVHSVFLVVDIYTVLFLFGLHAAAVTRPHVLADGVLRVRRAAHVDIRVPLDRIASIRRETRFTHDRKDGELNLTVGAQTSLTLDLTEPVDAPQFFGAPRLVRVIRLHADDPKALHDAVIRARTASARGTAASG